MLTDEQLNQYHQNGFVIVEELFDHEEAGLLLQIALVNQSFTEKSSTLDQLKLNKKQETRVITQGDGGAGTTKFWVDDNQVRTIGQKQITLMQQRQK